MKFFLIHCYLLSTRMRIVLSAEIIEICKKRKVSLSIPVILMLQSFVFTFELFFLFFLSFVHCQRYYAFVETLFVIDKNYFPQFSTIGYEQYVQTIVDTANIVENKFISVD